MEIEFPSGDRVPFWTLLVSLWLKDQQTDTEGHCCGLKQILHGQNHFDYFLQLKLPKSGDNRYFASYTRHPLPVWSSQRLHSALLGHPKQPAKGQGDLQGDRRPAVGQGDLQRGRELHKECQIQSLVINNRFLPLSGSWPAIWSLHKFPLSQASVNRKANG